MFVGHPKPAAVAFGSGSKGTVTVTVRFNETVVCRKCRTPPGVSWPHARRVRIALDAKSHQTVGFGLYRPLTAQCSGMFPERRYQ